MLEKSNRQAKTMRLWSVSPTYLDRLGLIAVWREGLLAQQVIAGNTRGYKHHPQLIRFQTQGDPQAAIGAYLTAIAAEAADRAYNFDDRKIIRIENVDPIPVTRGQLEYEFKHLLNKLRNRDQERYHVLREIINPAPHPSFTVIPGEIAPWEKVAD